METPTRVRRGRVGIAMWMALAGLLLAEALSPGGALPLLGIERSRIERIAADRADAADVGPRSVQDPVRAYLDAAFGALAGRAPTPDEVEQWRFAAEVGDLGSVSNALAVSDEWAGARISELYEGALGRPADPEGQAHWVARVTAGDDTLEAVAGRLYGSTEYYVAAGSTAQGFVDHLYQDLLGRTGDPAGRSFWAQQVAAGRSRASVAATFYASVEARTARVEKLYESVLDRPADPGGAATWVPRVRQAGDVALASALASSAEFFEQATGVAPVKKLPRGRATGFQPFAAAGNLVLDHPAAVVDAIGFHQSGHATARPLRARPTAVNPSLLWNRGRGTDPWSAADIVVPPDTEIRSPVTGTVVQAGQYQLYCKYLDERLVIQPDGHPGRLVTMLHITGLRVRPGDRLDAGMTVVAARSTVLPFASQVERLSDESPWPHVHVEVLEQQPAAAPPAPPAATC